MRKEANNKTLLWLVLVLAGGVTLTACTGAEQDQTVADLPIAYIKRPIPIVPMSNPPRMVDPDVRDPIAFNSGFGGDIYIRTSASPSASEENITSCRTRYTGADPDGVDGDVKDLEASYDGTKLIFALMLPHVPVNNPTFATRQKWDIYEYDTTVGGCPTPVISGSEAQEGDDVAPAYLPGGRIVFSSNRQDLVGAIQLNEGGKPQFPSLDEDQGQEAVVLHVMRASGTNIQQISFNQSHDLDPSVLSSGEILFSRWDHMGNTGANRGAINLYKIRPDGTELKALYGVHGHDVGTGGSTVQFLSARELEDGRILSMIKPFNGSAGGGAPVIINAAQFADNTRPIWPYPGLTGNGQVNAVALGVTTDNSISPAGRFRSVHPLLDSSNRALVSWTQCRLEETDGDIVPCPDTIPAGAVEAFPVYGLYVYDLSTNTQLPVVIPQEGIIIDEPVVMSPRTEPDILFDIAPDFGLDQTLHDEFVGLLHIRSVYEMDGQFNRLGASVADVPDFADMADPSMTDADERPARFLRIIKGAYIPEEVDVDGDADDDPVPLDAAAFGRTRQNGMRELLGYAPIEPDGSVLVKVPANVPFSISVVDKDGRRIGDRHLNWLQLRRGQTLQCNGCHDHPAGNPPPVPLPHGYSDEPTTVVNAGATIAAAYTGANPAYVAEIGDTMAMTRIRTTCGPDASGPLGLNVALFGCPELTPNINLWFTDVWADPAGTPTPDLEIFYAGPGGLTTQIPENAGSTFCESDKPSLVADEDWQAKCRVMINYEESIHPLWAEAPRTVAMVDRVCTNCHDSVNNTVVPDAHLDLSDGLSQLNGNTRHFKSYSELFVADLERELDGTIRVQIIGYEDRIVDGVPVIDPMTGLVIQDPIIINFDAPGPSMSVGGSRAGYFVDIFLPGGIHAGYLTAAEIRLISEWLDMGAQYFNNPFHANVPTN